MKFILGRSGTGKTTFVLNEINKDIKSGFDKPIIYIVPEQFSFESEKKLIEAVGKTGIIGAQVLSFKRLAYKIFSENNISVNGISKSGESMLIYFIMLKLDKELELLKGVEQNIGLIDVVTDQIAEFKRYNIDADKLASIDFKNEYLNKKIHDLALIYNEYLKRIKDSYIDSNDELTILADVISNKDTYLNGAKIYIDAFDGFIPQEFEIIKALNKKCDVTISMISDDQELFELNNQNLNRLKKLDNNEGNLVTLTENKRISKEDLKFLEENIFRYNDKKFKENVENINICRSDNTYEEIESVAKQILLNIRNNNLKYSNIAIVTNEPESYKNIFKMVFSLYNIPFFIDDKKELSREPLMTLILALFDIVMNNYNIESIFTYLKTGFLSIDENDIDVLENYALKWGIKGKRWEEDFTISDEYLEKINIIRKQVIDPIISFKSNFSGRKTVKEIIKAIYEFLYSLDLYDTVNAKIESLIDGGKIRTAQEYLQVWNNLMDIFDDMANTIGNENISFEKFQNVFKIGISNYEISVIPSAKDQVMIGDVERTRNSDIKVLFIIGTNEGIFPKVFASEGFINDKERELLKENGMEIAKDTVSLLKLEYFNIYKALSMAEDKLYISYPASDLEGKVKRPSFIINQIKDMFEKMAINNHEFSDDVVVSKNASMVELLNKIRSEQNGENVEDFWKNLRKWYEANDSDRFNSLISGLDYKNTVEYMSKEMSKRIYGTEMNTSVSRLEAFSNCPFSFYLRYGLNLKEREVYKLDVPDIGSLLHAIIECFSKKIIDENIDIRTLDKEKCDSMVANISDSVLIDFRNNLFSSTGKLRNLSIKLKEQVKKMIWLIVSHIKSGNFDLMGSEVEFGKGKDYPEIVIELDDNEKLVLSGKVDRVDVARLDDGNYIRIVDYKSSNKEIKLSNVYYGIQLQLLAYADAITGNDYKPSGVFYLKLDDPVRKTDKRISKEEVEESIRKQLRMNGLVISNVKLIEAMDNEFNESKAGISYESDVLNLKKSKEGNLSKMPAVSADDFENLRKNMHKTLKDIGNEILKGNIKNEPLYRNGATLPCEYCNYKKACMFEKKLGNKYKRINELKDEEVLKIIKE